LGSLILLVSALVFVDDVFFTAITPLLPHYVHVFHLTKAGAGLLVAAYPFGTLLASIPSGMLASRIGVRPAVLVGLTLMSAATLTFGLAGSVWLLDVARLIQGVGGACTWSGGLAWLASAAPSDRRAAALGVTFGAAVGGSLLGPIIGVVASTVGTGPTFAGATGAAICLVAGSFFVRTPESDRSQSFRSALLALRDRSLSAGLWLTCLSGLAFGVVDVLVPLRLARLGAGAGIIGAAFLGSAGVEVVLSPLVGRVADVRGKRMPVRLLVTFAVGVSLLLPFVEPAAALVVVVVVGLSAFGTLFVPAAALTSDGAQRQGMHQGMGFGLSNLAWAGGQAVAAAGSGALARVTSDTVPCAILAAAFACTLVAVSFGHRAFGLRLASGAKSGDGLAVRLVAGDQPSRTVQSGVDPVPSRPRGSKESSHGTHARRQRR
jgi:MFS family permease